MSQESNIELGEYVGETIEINKECVPNAARLCEALRHIGYTIREAVCELIDNSIDAIGNCGHLPPTERKIMIWSVKSESKKQLVFGDYGCGMDIETLDEAIKIGSNIEKNPSSDLGLYGMGMFTSIFSYCRKFTILTKCLDGDLIKAIVDLDVWKNKGQFKYANGLCTDDEKKYFYSCLPNAKSGTVIITEKIDRLHEYPAMNKSLTNKLIKELGRVYRVFIDGGYKIYVDNILVAAVDPLKWSENGVEQFYEDSLPVKVKLSNGKEEITYVDVKLSILPVEYVSGKKVRADVGIQEQGFSVLRNSREIANSVTLGLFAKHQILNPFRGEINFSGKYDSDLGVTFSKNSIKFSQSVEDKFKEAFCNQIKAIRKKLKKNKDVNSTQDIQDKFDLHEKKMAKIKNLLINPPAKKEKREPGDSKGSCKPKNTGRTRTVNKNKSKRNGDTGGEKWELFNGGKYGPLYEVDQSGKDILIRANIQHPFGEKIRDWTDPDHYLPCMNVIASFARAQLLVIADEPDEDGPKSILVAQLLCLFSQNLAVMDR